MPERTLKEQALLERIAEMSALHEDKDADRRVDITHLTERIQVLETEIKNLREQVPPTPPVPDDFTRAEVIEGEVVDDSEEPDEG